VAAEFLWLCRRAFHVAVASGPLSLRLRGLSGELIDEIGLLVLLREQIVLLREQIFVGRLLRGLRFQGWFAATLGQFGVRDFFCAS